MSLSHASGAEQFPSPDRLPRHPGLPNPLVSLNGETTQSVAPWEAKRKPELKSLFEHYMYGRLPQTPGKINAVELYRNDQAFDGKVALREVELQFDVNGIKNPTPIRLLIAQPPGPGPFPCFIGLSFAGNHALAPDEGIRIPDSWQYDHQPGVVKNKATAAGRGKQMDVWPLALAVSRGYAVAVFYAGDIQPDRPNVMEGLRAAMPTIKGKPDLAQTATVMSWAWGVHRCVDYLTTQKQIDGKRLAVVGHSRLGKASLVAGAFDDRIAVVMPHQAGCGGTGPSRHQDPKAESVKRINTSFPHWFCGHFKEFNDDTSKLPFDQNGLVALCAPRPVLFTNAAEDLWANPSGQLAVLKAAEPAYKLYGVEGCAVDAMPDHDKLIKSRLGYFIRPGKHAMTIADWNAFLDYADVWLKKK
ncbi:MAG: acetylxylan esterase [Gemmataceae bacterium]